MMRIYYLAILIFISCNSAVTEVAPVDEIRKVILSSGACLGFCPTLTIEIDKDLNYKFYGSTHTTRKGFYVGKATPFIWRSLTNKLDSCLYQRLSNAYDFGYLDEPPVEVTIYFGENKKTISGQWKSIPSNLSAALNWLLGSYPYIDLKKVDTLTFESSLHERFVNPQVHLRSLEDSLKRKR
jgi:Domain of unknown function (DUF6438)